MRWIVGLVLMVLLGGCEVHIKIGNPGEQPEWKKKPWFAWATSERTGAVEFWWAYYETRDECLHRVEAEIEGVQSAWYRKPVGCGYRGSDSAFWLFMMNRIYASEAMECVARRIDPSIAVEYFPVAKGSTRKSPYYKCVWG